MQRSAPKSPGSKSGQIACPPLELSDPSFTMVNTENDRERKRVVVTERVRKTKAVAETKKVEEVQPEPKESKSAEDIKAESDALLDEIDSLLEENAEEFVRGYVQKGGQ